ncbi:MAG: hypothetical protein IJ808_02760 [Muribaculaceae bacterium]|nr:hypothetical protein [Muribaculaceae bacterium]
MLDRAKYILLQSLLFIVSPICSFAVSLRFYRNAISQLFMILFAYYFGYYCGFVFDLMTHYRDIKLIYYGRTLTEILNDPRAYFLGQDFFHIAIKYAVSRFSDSAQVFGGVVAACYASVFLFFFRQFSRYYKDKLPLLCGVLLLCVVCVVEYYWYQGVRFWTGLFFFAGCYIRFVNTRKTIYFILSLLCPVFHYSLYTLVAAAIVNQLLMLFHPFFRYLFLGFSLFIRTLGLDFVPFILKKFSWLGFMNISLTDIRIRENVVRHMSEYRASASFTYLHRNDVLLAFGLIIMGFFYRNKLTVKSSGVAILFYMALTLFTFANIGYTDMTFYDRFYKAAVLLLYSYIFISAATNYDKISKNSLFLSIIALAPLVFALATAIVAQRDFLFHKELLLGNLFLDWDGNASNYVHYWR